jgi:hypothetical protein
MRCLSGGGDAHVGYLDKANRCEMYDARKFGTRGPTPASWQLLQGVGVGLFILGTSYDSNRVEIQVLLVPCSYAWQHQRLLHKVNDVRYTADRHD